MNDEHKNSFHNPTEVPPAPRPDFAECTHSTGLTTCAVCYTSLYEDAMRYRTRRVGGQAANNLDCNCLNCYLKSPHRHNNDGANTGGLPSGGSLLPAEQEEILTQWRELRQRRLWNIENEILRAMSDALSGAADLIEPSGSGPSELHNAAHEIRCLARELRNESRGCHEK